MAWDDATDVFFASLVAAVERGVKVRLLLDHLGSRAYPGLEAVPETDDRRPASTGT